MSLLNIGLKSIIKPDDKLSGFCKKFISQIYPQFKIEVSEDSDFQFTYKQFFPDFNISFCYRLERETSIDTFLSAKILMFCNMENKQSRSNIFIKFSPEKFDAKIFLDKLNSDSFFIEFYHYSELFKNWTILDDSLRIYEKTKHDKNEVICPNPIQINRKEFTVTPAIIKYNLDKIITLPRYDLCTIISWNEHEFVDEEDAFEENIFVNLKEIKIKSNKKETIRSLLIEDYLVGYNNLIGKNMMFFSTLHRGEEFYTDLIFDKVESIKLVYSISTKSYETTIDLKVLEKISELWHIYSRLQRCGQKDSYH